jgi:hypothetical protein
MDAWLIVVKPATVPPDDQQELDHVLVAISLDRAFDLELKL